MLEFILILLEFYFPSIFYKTFNVTPSFLLLLIIFVAFNYGQKSAILIAFLFGFIKDILIQYSSFGLLTLLTCIFAYCIVYLIKINDIKIKYMVSFFLFLIYFYFYYLFQFSSSYILYLELSFMKTLMTIIAYFIINFIFNKRYKFFEK
tara:strand:- start:571 stop:1017 length:447 start_codon:yes stop_codon:yes gene_type:complete